MKENYDELLRRFREISVISQIAMLTGWDTEVMMPKGGIEQRGNQQAFLAKLIHGKMTDPEIGKLLQEIKNDTNYENLSLLEKRTSI